MKKCSNCKKIKDLSCFGKKSRNKDGLDYSCKECIALYYIKNKEILDAKQAVYGLKNKEKIAKRKAEKYQKNRENKLKYWANYRKENKGKLKQIRDKNKEKRILYDSLYYQQNREKIIYRKCEFAKNKPEISNFFSAKRRAQKRKATPHWLTEDHWKQIEQFYIEAIRLTKETGIKHDVDHIIPLTNSIVSGLHVPWNLQILTKSANCSKKNKLIKNT